MCIGDAAAYVARRTLGVGRYWRDRRGQCAELGLPRTARFTIHRVWRAYGAPAYAKATAGRRGGGGNTMRAGLTGLSGRGRRANSLVRMRGNATWELKKQPKTNSTGATEIGDRSISTWTPVHEIQKGRALSRPPL